MFDNGVSYTDAEQYCKDIGGHLVTITSKEENEFVYKLVNHGNKDAYWLGLNDAITEGDFYWVTFEPVTYTNWNSGEPNNRDDEDFAEMRRNNGKWNDNSSKLSNTVADYTICVTLISKDANLI